MEILASVPCKIIEGVIVNGGKFIKLELQMNAEASSVYLLTDPEPKFIKDLSTQQFMFAYSVFTSDENYANDYYTSPKKTPQKRKMEQYVIATEQTYPWRAPLSIPSQIYIVYSYELVSIYEIIEKIRQTKDDIEKSRLMFLIGCCYGGGCLTKEDLLYSNFATPNMASAIEWYERSVKLGNIEAKKRLANILYHKKRFENTKKALVLFSDLSRQGDAYAKCMEGLCFLRWEKYDSAKTCLLKAAENGCALAEYNIGKCIDYECFMLEDKNEIDKYSDAIYWYCRAARHNQPNALNKLAEYISAYEQERFFKKGFYEYEYEDIVLKIKFYLKDIYTEDYYKYLMKPKIYGTYEDSRLTDSYDCRLTYHDEYFIEDTYSYDGERKYEPTYSAIDDDWERQSYLALGGDPERYREGCLDDYMDSIGL